MAANKNAKEAEKIDKNILRGENIVELEPDEPFCNRHTTQEVIETEILMVQAAKELANSHTRSVFDKDITKAIEESEKALSPTPKTHENQFKFDPEQVETIYSMLSGGDFSIVQGSAGADKTASLLPVKLAIEKKGLRIEGACIAKRAADNLSEETGIKSQTIASIVKQIENVKDPLKKLDVLVIDEAGHLPSTDFQLLLYSAKENQCKIILTGEDKQLDSIERGGALRYLSRPEVIGTQRIQNIRRQNTEWARTAVANLRDGKSVKALSSLEKHKCLHWGENNDDTKKKLVADWHAYHKANPDKHALVMAQKWSDVKELSEIIRGIYVREGTVGQENIPITCSVADKQFEYEFSIGDRIKFTRNEYRQL